MTEEQRSHAKQIRVLTTEGKPVGALLVLIGLAVLTADVRRAGAQPAVSAGVIAGVDQDSSAIGRLFAGGLYGVAGGQLAFDAHIGFEGFLRLKNSAGVDARSFTLLDLGARYAFMDPRSVGLYAHAGGSFGIFTGKPHERRVDNEPETCASAMIPDDQPQDRCAFDIDKNLSVRFGLGWGFRSSDEITVAIRLDITYWMFSLNDFDPASRGQPIPRMVPRPQDAWSFLIGFEFLRWFGS